MDQQEDITAFQSQFNGPFPFRSDGVLIGLPDASFEEEMESMITFAGGTIDLDTFNHENMHQWWGDNVTEANYNLTFFKEGMATARRVPLRRAKRRDRRRRAGHGGRSRRLPEEPGQSVRRQLRAAPTLWSGAPSNPTSYSLFSGGRPTRGPAPPTSRCARSSAPAASTVRCRRSSAGTAAASITERQLEAAFARLAAEPEHGLPVDAAPFFTQWFDTAYPTSGGATKPSITGPGLHGGGFYNPDGTCS